ncbi:MAG: DUF4157 domain-containing protein [Myxococcota bacterium]
MQRLGGGAPTAPFGTIVEDGATPAPGQVRRLDFVAVAAAAVEAAASAELARVGRTAKDCPYLERSLRFYRQQSASHLERTLARYAHPKKTDPAGLVAALVERVRTAVSVWITTGRVELPAMAPVSSSGGPVQGFDGGLHADPGRVRASLGAGRPLEGATRNRMERGFGRDFSDVRVHTDAAAARTAASLSARAFTVGNEVAFGAGQFRPGTPQGELMLAHELAHVLQQRGAAEDGAQAWSTSSDGPLEADADRAAVSAVARAGLTPHAIAQHVALHTPTRGAGLRLQRCSDDEPVDYAQAPEPPDYDAVVEDLRSLYAEKKRLAAAPTLDEAAWESVNARLQARLDELKLLGISSDDLAIEKAVTTAAGATELRVANPRITRTPAEGPLFQYRRMRFQLSTDWLPPDELPQVEWRWTAGDEDYELRNMEGLSIELNDQYWGSGIGLSPGWEDVQSWKEHGGATIYAVVKLGDKPPIKAPGLWVPYDARQPHEVMGGKFEIEPTRPVLVVGESAKVVVKDWIVPTMRYWVEWRVDGTVVNFHPGMGGGVLGKPFDSPGTRHISARLFERGDVDGKTPLGSASTTVEVQDVVATGQEALTKGQELGAYTPLSGFGKAHADAMAAMGTRAKLGSTGGAKDYWEKRLAAEQARFENLKEKVPDFETAQHVEGKDFGSVGTSAATASSTPIPTVIVYPSRGGQVVQPVSVYLVTRKVGAKWKADLADVTGKKVYLFEGDEHDDVTAAAKSAFEDWEDDNPYPTGGTVVYGFNPPGWSYDKTFSTSSVWKYAEEFLDGLIAVGAYIAIGLLMLAPEATVTKVLGVALAAAVTARAAMAVSDNLGAGGELLDKENILEGVVILTSLLGGAGAVARTAGTAARASTLFRAGNWMLMTSFVAGAGTFVYATAEALAAIREVLKDPTLSASQRTERLMSVIAGLLTSGTLMFLSGRALVGSGLKASDFFKRALPKKGAGPIELSEGTRLDLEVELRKRGVPRDALKEMSPEALLDTYFNVTATRPELVRIPDAYKGLPAKEAAAAMGLETPPPGYYWTKVEGRLAVGRTAKARQGKLVYDPAQEPGKRFIADPTVARPKVAVVPAVKVAPAELQAPASEALAARDAITNPPVGKTVARAPDGTTRTSGWGSDVDSLKPVEELSGRIGHQAEPHFTDPPGRPGWYHYSHAEKQLAAARPGKPIGVSRVMCLDCQTFFAKLATSTGKPVVVADPAGVRVFLPGQPMVTAPNAAAVPGAITAAAAAREETGEE